MTTTNRSQFNDPQSWRIIGADGKPLISNHPPLTSAVTIAKANKTDWTKDGPHTHNVYIVSTKKGVPGILAHTANTCLAQELCTHRGCHKYHFEPGDVVTTLIGRDPMFIGTINPVLLNHRSLKGKMTYSPGQEKTIADLLEQAYIVKKEKLLKLKEKREREERKEAAMQAMDDELAAAMQPRLKKRCNHDHALTLALQSQLPTMTMPMLLKAPISGQTQSADSEDEVSSPTTTICDEVAVMSPEDYPSPTLSPGAPGDQEDSVKLEVQPETAPLDLGPIGPDGIPLFSQAQLLLMKKHLEESAPPTSEPVSPLPALEEESAPPTSEPVSSPPAFEPEAPKEEVENEADEPATEVVDDEMNEFVDHILNTENAWVPCPATITFSCQFRGRVEMAL